MSLKTDFPTNKKHVSTSRNEGLAKKYDPVDGKNTFTDNSWLMSRKRKKMVFTSHRIGSHPTNTQRKFQVETTWKRSFPLRFNAESTWCVYLFESTLVEIWSFFKYWLPLMSLKVSITRKNSKQNETISCN